jgi:signal transduction histidine kinase
MRPSFWDTERIAAIARLVLAAALSLALLLGMSRSSVLFPLLAFIFIIYFAYAVVVLNWLREPPQWPIRTALVAGDLSILVVVVLFAPDLPAAFLVFFLYFTVVAGLWQGWKVAAALSLLVSAGYLGVSWRQSAEVLAGEVRYFSWESWGVASVLLVAGTLIGALAERERHRLEGRAIVDEFSILLSLDTHWEMLWQRFLKALCQRYSAERAILAYSDPDTDRIVVWIFRDKEASLSTREEDRPPRDARTFFLESGPEGLVGAVRGGKSGEGWQWQQSRAVGKLEPADSFQLPERFAHEFLPGSLLSTRLVGEGDWEGRIFLLDHRGKGFGPDQLQDLQELMKGLAPTVTTLLTIRRLVAQATNQERERIVRELHDGIAQALASVEMQLSVFRRLAGENPEQLSGELARLQGAVGREREEFRRFLRELKPLRVPPNELAQRLITHCAQFQQETGITVDVQAEPPRDDVPEGICREVFLILREALHNVRKHSGAKSILVEVKQNSDGLSLLVDDDGAGFPFTGTYSHEALREKSLAPTALWDRLQGLGGTLEIESQADTGATLRMEIPLN